MSEATLQALLVLDAAGMDELLLETVGVGQSEVEVASLADTVLLVLQPGSGDSIQALKAGVMEIPDIIVINKSDHPAARTMRAEIRSVLALDPATARRVPIVETEAFRSEGIAELWQAVLEHRAHLAKDGGLEARRRQSIEHEIVAVAVAQARRRLSEALEQDPELRRLLDDVHARRLDPLTATREISERVFRGELGVTASAAERYIWLGLHLGRHVEGIVDSYSGPAELAAAVDAEPPAEPSALVAAAEGLLDELD